jgi:hypothetical protein
MNSYRLARFSLLATTALLLSSCANEGGFGGLSSSPDNLGPAKTVASAIGNQTMNGVPIGTWLCQYVNPVPVGTATVRANLIIRDDGSALLRITSLSEFKGGYSIGMGKFAGLKRVMWLTEKRYPANAVKRVGEEIMIYSDPNHHHVQLVSGTPAGYTLNDYETLGAGKGERFTKMLSSIEGGVTIFKIQGKNLVLENSEDGSRWLYRRG